jgi:hypothetical protein
MRYAREGKEKYPLFSKREASVSILVLQGISTNCRVMKTGSRHIGIGESIVNLKNASVDDNNSHMVSVLRSGSISESNWALIEVIESPNEG